MFSDNVIKSLKKSLQSLGTELKDIDQQIKKRQEYDFEDEYDDEDDFYGEHIGSEDAAVETPSN